MRFTDFNYDGSTGCATVQEENTAAVKRQVIVGFSTELTSNESNLNVHQHERCVVDRV